MPANRSGGYKAGVVQSTQPYTKWDADRDEVEVDYKQVGEESGGHVRGGSSCGARRKAVVVQVMVIVAVFCLGLVLGYVVRHNTHYAPCPTPQRNTSLSSGALTATHFYNISPDSLRNSLRSYSKEPHLTGTAQIANLRQNLLQDFKLYHIDTHQFTYSVLLSYHNWGTENKVSLLNEAGSVVMNSSYHGPPLGLPNPASFPVQSEPYNAYSPNGTVEGQLVYANFGEESDFAELKKHGVSCNDSIVIMRYGRVYRGSKVARAEKCGAKGVILYSDPAQVLGPHMSAEEAYPHSWWLPQWAAQRGSVLPHLAGDPLSPEIPSKDGMFRIKMSDAALPKIPVQPIGYKDAHDLMQFMAGPLDDLFLGNMHENVSYAMGPGYRAPRENHRVRLEVNNEMEVRQVINVIGEIKGELEPDRYVIIGCHYDAWLYGAVDPNSGTAVLMEMAKAFGEMVQKGWRPRRTILFANWDGEEQGLIGSYEWVEDHLKTLAHRTVVYINLDSAVKGNSSLHVTATPLLKALLYNVTQSVSVDDKNSVYDVWTRNHPTSDQPLIPLIGSGSDHAPFLFTLGVPVMWPQYVYNKTQLPVAQYPAYHTALDRITYMERFVDPDYQAATTLTRTMTLLVQRLSSDPRLPLDTRELAHMLEEEFNGLRSTVQTNTESLGMVKLQEAITKFSSVAAQFHNESQHLDMSSDMQVRRHNDALLHLMHCFIHQEGLPSRTYLKNVLFAPNSLDSYSADTFSGIKDSYRQLTDTEQLEKQITLATLAVQCASQTLAPSPW